MFLYYTSAITLTFKVFTLASEPFLFLLFSRSQKAQTVTLKMDYVVGLVRKTGR